MQVYNTVDGTLVQPLKGHRDTVYCVSFGKDGINNNQTLEIMKLYLKIKSSFFCLESLLCNSILFKCWP